MNNESILGLVHNAALLLALVLLFDLFFQNWNSQQNKQHEILSGIGIGIIGITIMFTPWVLTPGLIFDTRSILLGISGLFFGPLPTVIAMLMTLTLRIIQGGSGAIMGVCVILASGTIGMLWRHLRKKSLHTITWQELYLFGILIHVVMLALAFTMPLENALRVINSVSLPVMIIYPVATAVLGIIMTSHTRRTMITQNLKESETRYRIVADNTYNWEYWFGTNGMFVYCSPSCKNISGYSPEELLNNPDLPWEMIYPDDMEIYKKHRETPAVEKAGKPIEFRIIHKNGPIRWISHVCRPVYSDDGKLMGTRGSNRDITEQKSAEAALRENEEKYRLVVENQTDWIAKTDAQGKYLFANQAFCECFGKSEDELIGTIYNPTLHPDDAENVIARWPELTKSSYSLNFDSWVMTNKGWLWSNWTAKSFENNEGQVDSIILAGRDISERKEAQKALNQSEEKYRILTESIADVIWILDTESLMFKYVSKSVEKMRGFTVEEVMAKPMDEALTPESRAGLRLMIRERKTAFLDGTELPDRVFIDEVEQPCKDGTTVLTEVSTSFYLNPETNLVEVRGVSRNISERKRMEDALHKEINLIEGIMNSVPGLLYLYDEKRKLIRWNKKHEEITGYSAQELHNFQLMDWFKDSPEDTENVTRGIDRALKEGFGTAEANLQTKSGKKILFDFTATKLELGKKIYFTGIGIDITARRLNEQKIAASQKELQEILEKLKHELEENEISRRVLLSISEDQQIARNRATQLSKEVLVAYDATLEGWAAALELREKETAHHSRNVVEMTLKLARKLGSSEEDTIHIRRGALLHDIGKMGIPDNILLKPGPLTPDEWVIMRMHPDFAYKLLSDIPYLQPALDIPYAHHERWDGSGYPKGLQGTDIPLFARVFAVVDVWDALSSDRPYRPAWKKEAVNKYMKEQAGIQFDPQIVELFLEILDSETPSSVEGGKG